MIGYWFIFIVSRCVFNVDFFIVYVGKWYGCDIIVVFYIGLGLF